MRKATMFDSHHMEDNITLAKIDLTKWTPSWDGGVRVSAEMEGQRQQNDYVCLGTVHQ